MMTRNGDSNTRNSAIARIVTTEMLDNNTERRINNDKIAKIIIAITVTVNSHNSNGK